MILASGSSTNNVTGNFVEAVNTCGVCIKGISSEKLISSPLKTSEMKRQVWTQISVRAVTGIDKQLWGISALLQDSCRAIAQGLWCVEISLQSNKTWRCHRGQWRGSCKTTHTTWDVPAPKNTNTHWQFPDSLLTSGTRTVRMTCQLCWDLRLDLLKW